MARGRRLIWLNGAFGVGKSTVAEHLAAALDDATIVDPEVIGAHLRATVPGAERLDDFQDLREWRSLTRETVAEVARSSPGRVVVVPMTVVDRSYLDEIVGGLRRDGIAIHHYTLVAGEQVVADRLRGRGGDVAWALERIERCVDAFSRPAFAVHLDASTATASELAGTIAARVDGAVR